jgi:hypothetical protein|nr:MAG TPA: Multidrug efflux pump subunit AcrB transporter, Multidrug efflux pump [Caudoviricetes sp.]
MSFEMALFAALLTVIGIPAVIYGLGELLTSLDCRTAPRQKRREIRAAMAQQPSPVTPGMTAMMCRAGAASEMRRRNF